MARIIAAAKGIIIIPIPKVCAAVPIFCKPLSYSGLRYIPPKTNKHIANKKYDITPMAIHLPMFGNVQELQENVNRNNRVRLLGFVANRMPKWIYSYQLLAGGKRCPHLGNGFSVSLDWWVSLSHWGLS